MADFTTLSATKNTAMAIGSKFDVYVSLDRKASKYETLGVVSNTGNFTIAQKTMEYRDGFTPWLNVTTEETLSIKVSAMQPASTKLLALATGRSALGESSSTYEAVWFTDTIPTKPYVRVKMVGQSVGGKAIEIELMKAQVKTDSVDLSIGVDKAAEIPFEFVGFVDSASTTGYKVGRYRVAL
jgi:hypothetical protein